MNSDHVVDNPDPDNPLFVEASELEDDSDRIIWDEDGINEDFDREEFLEGSE